MVENTLIFANQTLTDADLFGGISYTADLNNGDEFTIGNTASTSVRFVTDKQLPLYTKDATNGTFSWTQNDDDNFVDNSNNSIITDTDDVLMLEASRGRYYITEVTKSAGKYNITAYDAMILLDTNISALSVSLPATVSELASAIATYCGCTVSGTIYNGGLSVSALDQSMTIRQLLGHIAEASGCSVKIDETDHLRFMYYEDSGITLTASDYVSVEVADYVCAPIDNVQIINSIGMLQAEAGTGTNTLYIRQNPFMESATNEVAATILSVVDFEYAPLVAQLFDKSWLEIGTVATFGDVPTLIMHLDASETGGSASSVGSDNRAEYNKSLEISISEARSLASVALDTAEDAATKATAYITKVDDNGIRIHPVSTEDDAVLINGEGMEVFKGGASVAAYGDIARIGLADGYHTRISESGIDLRAGDTSMFSLKATGGTSSITNSQILLAVNSGTTGTSRVTSIILDPDIEYTFSMYASPSRGTTYDFTTSSASTVSKTVTSDDGKFKMVLSFATQTEVISGSTQITHVTCTITQTRTSTSYTYPAIGYRYTSEIEESTVHSLGNNNLLWEGELLMGDYDTITLNESVSAQLSGIVLAWSGYENGSAVNWSWHYTYVPKSHVFNHGGTGVASDVWTAYGANAISWKYVYINDTEIIGFSENDDTGTFAGIAFDNTGYVLRYVLGV